MTGNDAWIIEINLLFSTMASVESSDYVYVHD